MIILFFGFLTAKQLAVTSNNPSAMREEVK